MRAETGNHRLVIGLTAHGLGHLMRTCQLVRALRELDPGIELEFWSEFSSDRIAAEFLPPFSTRRAGYEPGTLQSSCFLLDRPATVAAYVEYDRAHDTLCATERAALRASGADAVLCDAPGMLMRAASEADLPSILVSNFTWDWILEPILIGTAAERALETMAADYALGSHHIRLPFGPVSSSVTSSEPGALVSRRARLPPDLVRETLGLPQQQLRPLALVCPGGWDPDGWSRIRPDTKDYDLILVGDLPIETAPGDVSLPHDLPAPVRFPDLVQAADVVLAKPGYGIASECVTHRTPLVTIDRPEFRETDVLRRQLAAMGPTAELSLEEFFAGSWTGALDAARTAEPAWAKISDHADRDVAGQVLSALGWR